MASLQVPVDLLVTGSEWYRDRWAVEQEKLRNRFPAFSFYRSGGRITSAQGIFETSYGGSYHVKVEIPSSYPYTIPKIWLPYNTIDRKCGHVYSDGSVCTLRSSQWSKTMTVAVILVKTAVWLNKYDSWVRNGKRRWPGKDQHRS